MGTVEAVRDRLRREILAGDLEAGAELPQVALAERLGISRSPLREALRMLQHEGLVEAHPNRSFVVAGFSLEDLDELYALRLTGETLGLRLSAPLISPEDIANLEGLLAQMSHFVAAEDYERWEVPHSAFHQGLVQHAGPRIRATLAQLSDHAERYRRFYTLETPRAWQQGHREHRGILDALKAGDVDTAAVRLAQHLARTPLTVIAQVDKRSDADAVRTALRELTGSDDLPSRKS
jgi:DNA-binding GntR family transcriptional regulator